MKALKITNLIKFNTILLLNQGPKHGYELIKELENHLGAKISTSHVYPFLAALKKQGYVTIKKGKRKKKLYTLTQSGRTFTQAMLNRFDDLITAAIKPKLTVCIYCGCKVYEGGHTERIKGKLMKFCCMHCARTYKNSISLL